MPWSARAAPTSCRRWSWPIPALLGQTRDLWLPADDEVDLFVKGDVPARRTARSSGSREQQIGWIGKLEAAGRLEQRFNTTFFTGGDSREPELAGIWGATKGSFFMLLVTLLLSFPLGVAAAIYLEEFAPRSWLVDVIEVNINNLAAVPSIVFGLLGLAVFINFFGLPRSAPLVGGLVLTLMTLPVVIIASRAAIKSVPPSVREAALGVGASKMQMVFHHVLPLALPGMLTGAIIGMARALGRVGAAADDRDGGLHRRGAERRHEPRHGPAGPDLPVGGQPRAGLRGADVRGNHGACWRSSW